MANYADLLGFPELSEEDKRLLHTVNRRKCGGDVERHYTVLKAWSSHVKDNFIQQVMTSINEAGLGSFTSKKEEVKRLPKLEGCRQRKPKETRTETDITTYFYCERHSVPRARNKTSDPEKTRANQCTGYIAFLFSPREEHSACVAEVRLRPIHTGHDLKNKKEWKANRLDRRMAIYIEELCEQNKKTWQILPKCWKYAKSLGHTDFHDHQYYPTPRDIAYFSSKVKQEKRFHKKDPISVHYMCTVHMEDRIIKYQSPEDGRPLIIVYQNKDQLERMRQVKQNVFFMDASYKGLTAYGYAVYCIHALKPGRGGVPLAYFILSHEDINILADCLQAIVDNAEENGITLKPRSFMVDKDAKEKGAIEKVFGPETTILLCWFHVLQAVYRRLNESDSGVSGKDGAPLRKDIVDYMRRMKFTKNEIEFQNMAEAIPEVFQPFPNVVRCLQQWNRDAKMWANFGRPFCHEDQETNNVAERFFLELKYNFLGGYANRRVDDLLLLLDEGITEYQSYMDHMEAAGRLKEKMPAAGKEAAKQLLLQGWDQKCTWVDDRRGLCLVPSSNKDIPAYEVNLVLATCSCFSSTQLGMCKHMHVALHVASRRNINIQSKRQITADELVQSGSYIVDGQEVTVLGDDVSTVTGKTRCTCVAASHEIMCICRMVATAVLGDVYPALEPEAEEGATAAQVENEDVGELEMEEQEDDGVGYSMGTVQAMRELLGMVDFMQSGKFEAHPQKEEIERNIAIMSAKLKIPDFNVIRKDRIQKPNSEYRRAMEQRFKEKRKQEHAYGDEEGKPCQKKFHRMQGASGGRRNVLK